MCSRWLGRNIFIFTLLCSSTSSSAACIATFIHIYLCMHTCTHAHTHTECTVMTPFSSRQGQHHCLKHALSKLPCASHLQSVREQYLLAKQLLNTRDTTELKAVQGMSPRSSQHTKPTFILSLKVRSALICCAGLSARG